MKDMILFPEDIDLMNSVLSQLVKKANLLLAILINKDGRLLTSQGTLEQVDIISMAALVAGNSASTLAIANLVGEREFSTMYHQGKEKHIYIATVDDNTFLSLIFDDRTNIDRVKVFARQFDRQLKECLRQVYNKSEEDINLDLDMGQLDQFSQPNDFNMPGSEPYPPELQIQQQNNNDSGMYFLEGQKEKPKESIPVDTNYLFLQNKIKEGSRSKKQE